MFSTPAASPRAVEQFLDLERGRINRARGPSPDKPQRPNRYDGVPGGRTVESRVLEGIVRLSAAIGTAFLGGSIPRNRAVTALSIEALKSAYSQTVPAAATYTHEACLEVCQSVLIGGFESKIVELASHFAFSEHIVPLMLSTSLASIADTIAGCAGLELLYLGDVSGLFGECARWALGTTITALGAPGLQEAALIYAAYRTSSTALRLLLTLLSLRCPSLFSLSLPRLNLRAISLPRLGFRTKHHNN